MLFCLHQRLTHDADRPFTWAVSKIAVAGRKPEPLGLHDESPAELTTWARDLNASNADVGFDFGIIDRSAITDTLCIIDRASFEPVDSRGRWIAATGFGNGSDRPYGLCTKASWKHCAALARILDEFYGTDSHPAPTPLPEPPKPLTPKEILSNARSDLRLSIGGMIGHARGFNKTSIDQSIGDALAQAMERYVDARLGVQPT
jgi:hypothetical protein